jgi:hypothetical protein
MEETTKLVKVNYDNGDYLFTRIKATKEDITRNYLWHTWYRWDGNEVVPVTCTSIEFLETKPQKVFVLSVCFALLARDEIIGVYTTEQAAIEAQNAFAHNDCILQGRLDSDCGVSLVIQEFELQEEKQ